MEKECAEERCALINSAENSVKPREDDGGGEEDDEEALSFCDLPLRKQSRKDNEKQSINPLKTVEIQDDFDFCFLSKECQMCAADEVFYQGQILPLCSKKGFLQYYDDRNFSMSVSRSRSNSSDELFSSRSGSVSSHQSSSVCCGGGKLPRQNQFHSQPSPSPRIRFSSSRQGPTRISNRSSARNIFRLGLITTPPEIAFQYLETRCPRKNFNGTSRSSSDKKKSKQRALLGGCKCSLSAVDTAPSEVVIIRRRASEGENLLAMKSPTKGLSDHRTFEWLKLLSIEEGPDEP